MEGGGPGRARRLCWFVAACIMGLEYGWRLYTLRGDGAVANEKQGISQMSNGNLWQYPLSSGDLVSLATLRVLSYLYSFNQFSRPAHPTNNSLTTP